MRRSHFEYTRRLVEWLLSRSWWPFSLLRDKKINIIEEKVVGIHARHLKMAQMSKDELKQVVNFNRLVIKLANFVTSSEYPLGRYSFNKSWSLFWARIRFLWLFWIMFRMIMFLLFQSCEYHQLRYYLLDWTTFYPTTRRVGLIRSYISLCVFQLALKRSILFRKTTTKAFDPSLFLFLCRIPKKEDRKTSHLSDQVEPTVSPVDKQLQGDKENAHRDRRQSMYPAIRRFSQLEPVTSHFGANRLVLRDRAHWLCISEKLRKHQRRILVDTAPVGLVIIFASAFRLAFTHQVDASCAGSMPSFVRVIGTLEVMFCLTEALISTLGMMLHCQLVEADLKQQIYRIRTDLDLVISRLGPAKVTPIAPTSVGHMEDKHKHPTNQMRALKQAKSSRKHSATKPAVLSVDLNDELIAQCQLDIKRNPSFWSSSWSSMLSGSERAASMQSSTRKAYPLEEPTNGDHDHHRPTGEDLTLDPEKRFYYYPARPVMSSVDKVTGQGPSTTDYDDQKEMAEAQRKVVQMLSCLDGHKALVAFQGNSLYIWVASCLTFVPLLAGVRRMSSEERVAITLYLTISMLAFVTCMRFTVVCASINHNANQLAALIFRTCSSHHGRPLVRRWNKVFMIWYSPNRCAFRVLGLLDLTYVNILKTISFLLSGITLTLNYVAD